MIEITSRDNQHIKMARRVRDGRECEFIHIEGVRLVDEAIKSNCKILSIFVDIEIAADDRHGKAIDRSASQSTDVYAISPELLRHIADTENPQGIVVIAARPESGIAEIEERLEREIPLVLLLEEANNPSNIGAIIRSAEAAGIAGVITTSGSADAFSPKSIRASMGSCFRFPIWECVQIDVVLAWAKQRGIAAVGLAGNAKESIYNVAWNKPAMLVAGSEAHGLSPEFLAKLDGSVRIPMAEPVESLNLAAACGITMFECRRQYLRLGNQG